MAFRQGFTLIELLIVVAIIGILAAIAVPNFLNAQIRAKVARSQADMRSIRLATESYRMDSNQYPRSGMAANWQVLQTLTTPVAYLSSLPPDPFPSLQGEVITHLKGSYAYYDNWSAIHVAQNPSGSRTRGYSYLTSTAGPDKVMCYGDPSIKVMGQYSGVDYNPSNGINSNGDIALAGGSLENSQWAGSN